MDPYLQLPKPSLLLFLVDIRMYNKCLQTFRARAANEELGQLPGSPSKIFKKIMAQKLEKEPKKPLVYQLPELWVGFFFIETQTQGSSSNSLARASANSCELGSSIPPCPGPPRSYYMGGCQNYGPLLGPLNTRCRIIIGPKKGPQF